MWKVRYFCNDIRKPLSTKSPLSKDESVINQIREEVRAIGLPNLTVNKIQQRLKQIEGFRSISDQTIRKILKANLDLSFRACNGASIKYRDSRYDEKRLWMS